VLEARHSARVASNHNLQFAEPGATTRIWVHCVSFPSLCGSL